MRLDRYDPKVGIDEHFNSIYYLMLVVLGYKMVPYHSEKNVLILDFDSTSITDIPFRYLWLALDRLQTYYCANVQMIFVFNTKGIGQLWNMVSYFLNESQKRRIHFVQKGEESTILKYIDPY
jgi:hypothetical protein